MSSKLLKSSILCAVAAFCGFNANAAWTENKFYVEPNDLTVQLDETGTFALEVYAETNLPFRGFQFDVVVPEGIQVAWDEEMEEYMFTLDEERGSTKVFTVSSSNPDTNTYRVLCTSLKGKEFTETTPHLMTVTFSKTSAMTVGAQDIIFDAIKLSLTDEGDVKEILLDAVDIPCNIYTPATGSTCTMPADQSLVIGKTLALPEVTVTPANAAFGSVITWHSSDPAAVKVVDNNKVEAVAVGEAEIYYTITCDYDETVNIKSGSFKVTGCELQITGITLAPTSLTLYAGREATITATIAPEEAATMPLTWSSSDESVATVKDGVVTAVAGGSAVITASNAAGSVKATCDVTVKAVATSISITPATVDLVIDSEPITLTATILPEACTNQEVTWTSSNTAVATVDATGKVSVVGKGETTITATTLKYPDEVGSVLSATCQVAVGLAPQTITVEPVVALMAGENYTIKATSTNKEAVISYAVTSGSASVSPEGVVTSEVPGVVTVTITAAEDENYKSATAEVKLTFFQLTVKESEVTVYNGKPVQLTAELLPTDAGTIAWTSADEGIANVANGVITAVATGKTKVTATIVPNEGQMQSSYNTVTDVTVVIVPTSLTLSETEVTLYPDSQAYTIVANIEPAAVANNPIVWNSSDESVVTVANGVVTVVGLGTSTITATVDSYPGETLTATCKVTVEKRAQEITVAATNIYLRVENSFDLMASASSGLDVSYDIVSGDESITLENGVITGVTDGVAVIEISQAGNDIYAAAETVIVTVTVTTVQPQQVIWPQEYNPVIVGQTYEMHAYATSGLPVYYLKIGGDAEISINGNKITFLTVGTVVIGAFQDGSEEYETATSDSNTFNVIEDETTGIAGIAADENCEIFTLSGVRVFQGRVADRDELVPGLYIVRTAEKTIKVRF